MEFYFRLTDNSRKKCIERYTYSLEIKTSITKMKKKKRKKIQITTHKLVLQVFLLSFSLFLYFELIEKKKRQEKTNEE